MRSFLPHVSILCPNAHCYNLHLNWQEAPDNRFNHFKRKLLLVNVSNINTLFTSQLVCYDSTAIATPKPLPHGCPGYHAHRSVPAASNHALIGKDMYGRSVSSHPCAFSVFPPCLMILASVRPRLFSSPARAYVPSLLLCPVRVCFNPTCIILPRQSPFAQCYATTYCSQPPVKQPSEIKMNLELYLVEGKSPTAFPHPDSRATPVLVSFRKPDEVPLPRSLRILFLFLEIHQPRHEQVKKVEYCSSRQRYIGVSHDLVFLSRHCCVQ